MVHFANKSIFFILETNYKMTFFNYQCYQKWQGPPCKFYFKPKKYGKLWFQEFFSELNNCTDYSSFNLIYSVLPTLVTLLLDISNHLYTNLSWQHWFHFHLIWKCCRPAMHAWQKWHASYELKATCEIKHFFKNLMSL